jgi:hypothetical protein
MAAPLIVVNRNQRFVNKHQNVFLQVNRILDVFNAWNDGTLPKANAWKAGLAGLIGAVRLAESEGLRIRGLGGAWSLSHAATTQDIMVNTKPLNFVELGFKADSVDASFSGKRERLVFAQCGASVLELNQFLEARGFALPTAGASNGQTIVGAVATGTHGSANAVGSMQDYMLGLHVVAEGGKTFWIERASKPVVSAAFCSALGAKLLRDDALFNAAIVSFGSFGLIHALLFEAAPIYLLEKTVRRFDYATIRRSLSTLDVNALGLPGGAVRPFHYEIVINPHRVKAGERGCWVRAMYKRKFQPVTSRAEHGTTLTAGDDVMGFFGDISNIAPNLVPTILDHVLPSSLKELSGLLATPGETFDTTSIRGQVMSTELGVALADAESAVDAVIQVARAFPWAGFPAVRYVKGSQASLAFTRFQPITCTVELPSSGSSRSVEAFEKIWDELERRKVRFTLHWGQQLRADPARIRQSFGPARVNAWLKARRGFLGASGRRTFANGLLVSAGLAD